MDYLIVLIFALVIAGIFYLYQGRMARRLSFIRTYQFHKSIKDKILKKYPGLNDEQVHLVFRALRDYFFICSQARRKMVSMPSQVVDVAWHEFILFTRSYKYFCRKALGRFLHHTPTEAMSAPTLAQDGLKRAWRLACAKEKIHPAQPDRLPLLFAIDAMLDIPDGFSYVPDCNVKDKDGYSQGYCAGDIGCASGCAGDSGVVGGGSDSGGFFDGLFDSGGCGADCGGGCGGD